MFTAIQYPQPQGEGGQGVVRVELAPSQLNSYFVRLQKAYDHTNTLLRPSIGVGGPAKAAAMLNLQLPQQQPLTSSNQRGDLQIASLDKHVLDKLACTQRKGLERKLTLASGKRRACLTWSAAPAQSRRPSSPHLGGPVRAGLARAVLSGKAAMGHVGGEDAPQGAVG